MNQCGTPLVLMVLVTVMINPARTELLYNYGPDAGDSEIHIEGLSTVISTTSHIPILGLASNTISIDHRYVAVRVEGTRSLVLSSVLLDLTSGDSSLWYRVNHGPSMEIVSANVRTAYGPGFSGFVATHSVVVTYYRVHKIASESEEGIFQVGLVSDGNQTFVSFSYADITFTDIGMVGLVDHVTQTTFELPISNTTDMASVVTSSNVAFPGTWIYRIDHDVKGPLYPLSNDNVASTESSTSQESTLSTESTTEQEYTATSSEHTSVASPDDYTVITNDQTSLATSDGVTDITSADPDEDQRVSIMSPGYHAQTAVMTTDESSIILPTTSVTYDSEPHTAAEYSGTPQSTTADILGAPESQTGATDEPSDDVPEEELVITYSSDAAPRTTSLDHQTPQLTTEPDATSRQGSTRPNEHKHDISTTVLPPTEPRNVTRTPLATGPRQYHYATHLPVPEDLRSVPWLYDLVHVKFMETVQILDSEAELVDIVNGTNSTEVQLSLIYPAVVTTETVLQLAKSLTRLLQKVNSYHGDDQFNITTNVTLYECDFDDEDNADCVRSLEQSGSDYWRWSIQSATPDDYDKYWRWSVQSATPDGYDTTMRYSHVNTQELPLGSPAVLPVSLDADYVGSVCMEFSYLLTGLDHGTLSVYVAASADPEGGTLLWREGYYSSGVWQHAYLTARIDTGHKIYFVVRSGAGEDGGRLHGVSVDNIKLHPDVLKCTRLLTAPCSRYQMSPTDGDCVQDAWNTRCLSSASGSPSHVGNHDYISYGTLNNYVMYVDVLSARANTGDTDAVKLCYGDKYIKLSGVQAGRVDIFRSGRWGSICDDGFDDVDAKVICSLVNDTYIGGEARTDAHFGPGQGPILLNNLNCHGGEDNLYACANTKDATQWACAHGEDVGVMCYRDPGPISTVGPTPEPYPQTDQTISAVYIPGGAGSDVRKAGTVIGWRVYFTSRSQVYAQIWRPTSVCQTHSPHIRMTSARETYTLVHSKRIMGQGHVTITLPDAERTPLDVGDRLGFYVPDDNAVPYSVNECYSSIEQLRYRASQDEPPVVGQQLDFQIATMAWDPCRQYAIQAMINHTLDSGDVTHVITNVTTISPDIPQPDSDLVMSCDFEDNGCVLDQDQDNAHWSIISVAAPKPYTGPRSAASGDHYLYMDTSGQPYKAEYSFQTAPYRGDGSGCVHFQYSMVGVSTETLSVYQIHVETGPERRLVWTRRGPAYPDWNTAWIPVNLTGLTQVTGMVGIDAFSDIALDDLQIHKVPCSELEWLGDAVVEASTIPETPVSTAIDLTPETYHVSNSSTDTSSCGSARRPCHTISYVLSRSSSVVTLLISGHVSLDLDLAKQKLRSMTIAGADPEASSTLLVTSTTTQPLLSPDANSTFTYAFHDLRLVGPIDIPCAGANLYLRITNVYIERQDTAPRIQVYGCRSVVMDILNVSSWDLLFYLQSDLYSYIEMENVNASSATPGSNSTWLFYYPSKTDNQQHTIVVNNSLFAGLNGLPSEKNLPLAALAVGTQHEVTKVKLFVHNSNFTRNQRGIDVAVKGETVIEIVDCRFTFNRGNGAGGAVRVAASMSEGLDAQTMVEKLQLTISHSQFISNIATKSDLYTERDFYYALRSPGNGGAVYVYASTSFPMERYGRASLSNCTFINNTAVEQGGSIYLGPGLAGSMADCYMESSSNVNATRPRIGDILFASNSLSMSNTHFSVLSALSTTSVVFYQAADLLQNKLVADNVGLVCTEGFILEQLNSSMDSGIQTLQVYCRPCIRGHYSMENNSLVISGIQGQLNKQITCQPCPYGAHCDDGLKNMDNFWGNATDRKISMYRCPDGYCEMDSIRQVSYASCAAHRHGTLCGRCVDGYSEGLYGTLCIPNEHCGLWHYQGLAIISGYGLLFLLFLMVQCDWVRFLQILSSKLSSKDDGELNSYSNSDTSNSGYFSIFMYFIQAASLLRVKIVLHDSSNVYIVKRPSEFLPEFVVDLLEAVFDFDIALLQPLTCFFPDLQPMQKILIYMGFPLYMYCLLFMIYLLSGFCCYRRSPKKRLAIGGLDNDARMLATILALFLYTFQGIAEHLLLIVNCVKVDESYVLFHDGHIVCLQDWQYAVIGVIATCILPFFAVLLFGPILLARRKISVGLFFISLIFPLFLAPAFMVMFCNHSSKCRTESKESPLSDPGTYKALPDQRPNSDTIVGITPNAVQIRKRQMTPRFTNSYPNVSIPHSYEHKLYPTSRYVEGLYIRYQAEQKRLKAAKKKEITDTIVDLLTGPYRQDLASGLCWEGVMNFRRLILVVCFVVIPDVLVKQICLSMACASFLVVHVSVKPFKQRYSNHAETISLSLLLLLAVANLVRACYFSSGTTPMGDRFTVLVILEWVEIFCFTILPLVLVLLVLVAMFVSCGTRTKHQRDSLSRPDAIRYVPRRVSREAPFQWPTDSNREIPVDDNVNDTRQIPRPSTSPGRPRRTSRPISSPIQARQVAIPSTPPIKPRHSSLDNHLNQVNTTSGSLLHRYYCFDDDDNIRRPRTTPRTFSRFSGTSARPVYSTPSTPSEVRVSRLNPDAESKWANVL